VFTLAAAVAGAIVTDGTIDIESILQKMGGTALSLAYGLCDVPKATEFTQ
jgi:hypothetical protein